MSAVWLRFGAEIRARWRAWLLLTVLVGVAGGVTLGALAGARRTDAAYPEFLVSQRAYDVLVVSGRPPLFPSAAFDLDELAALPIVDESARFAVTTFFGIGPEGQQIDFDTNVPLVTTDGRYGTVINRIHLLEGRAPRRADEIAPSFTVAERADLQIGDVIDGTFFTPEQVEVLFETGQPFADADARRGRLRVVGIEASPGEFPPLSEAGSNAGFLHFAPSFVDSPLFAPAVESLAVRLKRGAADVPAFKAALERRAGGRTIFQRTQLETSTATERAIGVQADALRLVAILGALAGALLVGQALLRQARADAADQAVLRAIGMTPAQLVGSSLLRFAVIGAAGAALAVALAIALSPLTPVGTARNAEIDLGIQVDALVLGVGFVGVLAVVLLIAAPAALRLLGAARGTPRVAVARRTPALTSRAIARLAGLGSRPSLVSGVRFALEPDRGAAAAPVRSTIVGVAVAVVVLAGVAGFSSSLSHLLDEPRLYGWNWDMQLGDPFSPDIGEDVARTLAEEPDVGAAAFGSVLQMTIADRRVDVLGITSVKGRLAPAVADGRAPRGDDELALGRKTLAELDASIGDRVTVAFGAESTSMRIVGEIVLPDLGESGGLGHGGAMPLAAVRVLAPEAAANIVLLRASSPERVGALVDELDDTTGQVDELGGPYLPTRPVDLENVQRADSMPFVIAAGTAIVAVATIVHGLVASVRRRRRDLAVLKTLGCDRRQILQVVLWQATTIALVALVVGIPVGIIAGRAAWSLFAGQLGVLAEPDTSMLLLAALIPAVLLVANAAAAFPGRMAARTSPAVALRSE